MIARGARGAGRRDGLAVEDDPASARRDQGPGRVAGAARGRHRPGVHGAAARGAGHARCGATRNIWRCAIGDGALAPRFVAGRQHRGQRRRCGDRRRQRARAARAAVGRAVLLGPGPEGIAREPIAGARRDGVPRRARARWASATERLVALCRSAGGSSCRGPTGLRERAARLAKADLVTGMVGEFPELQGIMGGHYARAEGEPARVAAGDPRPLRAQGSGRPLPDGARERRRGPRRQAGHAGGVLRRRPQADRLQGPVRPQACRAGRHSAGPGERAAA